MTTSRIASFLIVLLLSMLEVNCKDTRTNTVDNKKIRSRITEQELLLNNPFVDVCLDNFGIYLSRYISYYYSFNAQTMAVHNISLNNDLNITYLHESVYGSPSRPVAVSLNDEIYIADTINIRRYNKYGDIARVWPIWQFLMASENYKLPSNIQGDFVITDMLYSGIRKITLILRNSNLDLSVMEIEFLGDDIKLLDAQFFSSTNTYGYIGRAYKSFPGLIAIVISKNNNPYSLGERILEANNSSQSLYWPIHDCGWTINNTIGVSQNTYGDLNKTVECMSSMLVVGPKKWIVPSLAVAKADNHMIKLRLTEYTDGLSGIPEFIELSSKEFIFLPNCKNLLTGISSYIESLIG